jgi:hypothetical protein
MKSQEVTQVTSEFDRKKEEKKHGGDGQHEAFWPRIFWAFCDK